MIRIGTAGWALPLPLQPRFGGEGSRLARYAAVFNATEINSTFQRHHRRATYLRWATSVPDGFRFAVKMPRLITHVHRLVAAEDALDVFLTEAGALGKKLGCLLVQLPPSLAFVHTDVERFLDALRTRHDGDVALEPRHESWFGARIDKTLERYRIARVAADPAPVREAAELGGWNGLAYWRLHGSPRTYYSSYADAALSAVNAKLRNAQQFARSVWCVFDNTASNAATANALALQAKLVATAQTGGAGRASSNARVSWR